MTSVEQRTEVITQEESAKLGVGPQENSELQGYLKDRTKGTAGDLVRNNKSGIGLESWRLLTRQFNPRTLTGTMLAQQREQHPRGAKTMAELPGALLEWEKSLRRCIQEGRKPPDDDWKRLTLLKMLPKA